MSHCPVHQPVVERIPLLIGEEVKQGVLTVEIPIVTFHGLPHSTWPRAHFQAGEENGTECISESRSFTGVDVHLSAPPRSPAYPGSTGCASIARKDTVRRRP